MKNNRLCVISAGWLLISTLLLNFLSACTSAPKHPATADGVLSAMMNIREAEECPDGRMRSLRVDTASLSYLSPTLVTAMYGEASRGWFEGENAPVSDMAMFLSEAMHPCELAVFRCADERDGLSVAAQCRSRLDLIKNAWKDSAILKTI